MSDLTDTGFWSGLRGWWNGSTHLQKGSQTSPIIGGSTPGGNSVTAEQALKISAVWACIGLRSESMASLPLNLRDKDKRVQTDNAVHRMIHESPNADMSAYDFWRSMFAVRDLKGNAYAEIKRIGTRPVALEMIWSEDVTLRRSTTGVLTYKVGDRIIAAGDMFHLKGMSLDGLTGLSPISYHAQTIGVQIDANRAAGDEFKNQLKNGGWITMPPDVDMTEKQRNQLRENLQRFADPANAGKWAVLEHGAKPEANTQMRINPIDAQLLESRYFGIEEITRAFRTPPQLIGHTSKASSWASSLEHINQFFLTYSCTPLLIGVEQEISRKLLSPSDRVRYKPKFSVQGLLRADMAGRAAFYSTMTQGGMMDRAEARDLEDLPPRAGTDTLTVQSALIPLDQVGKNFGDKTA